MTKPKVTLKYAPKWFTPILYLFGFHAWTSFWCTVYFVKGRYTRPLLAHELIHVKQINREGIPKFSVKYLYFWFKYGYRKNPYEVEAYAVMSEPEEVIKEFEIDDQL